MQDLIVLIHRYQATVEAFANNLRCVIGTHDLLAAVARGTCARTGQLSNGTRYYFHGVGCRVEAATISVEFDFGPHGRVDGFDAWRLHQFAEQFPGSAGFGDLKAVENALGKLLEQRVVQSPRLPPSPHLLYLAGEPPTHAADE